MWYYYPSVRNTLACLAIIRINFDDGVIAQAPILVPQVLGKLNLQEPQPRHFLSARFRLIPAAASFDARPHFAQKVHKQYVEDMEIYQEEYSLPLTRSKRPLVSQVRLQA